MEENEPVFGGGLGQMLWWAHTIPSISPHERTWHAVMMDKMRDGYLPENVNMKKIKLGRIDSVHMYAEAAMLMRVVEKNLSPDELHFVWAKYADPETTADGRTGDATKSLKLIGMKQTAHYLVRERAVRRTVDVVFMMLIHCFGNDKMRRKMPVTRIIQRSGNNNVRGFYADLTKIEEACKEIEDGVFDALTPIFRADNVI